MSTYVSAFSGAGGIDLGLDAAGWECVAQIEIDKWATKVLERHWPHVPRWADITTVNGADLPPADVFIGGFPCQDVSIAGLHAGLGGQRSGLFAELIRIAEEMRRATHNASPRVVALENVPGLLTSGQGRDFGVVLDSLADIGAVDIEWRIVDGQYFGPPQRRRRVFIVARFNSGANSGRPLLADPAGGGGHLDPRGAARPDDAGGLRTGIENAGGGDTTLVVQSLLSRMAKGPGTDETSHLVYAVHATQLPVTSTRVTPTLGHDCAVAVHQDGQGTLKESPIVRTLTTECGGVTGHQTRFVRQVKNVRRLTPRECERLQGWPDDHTRWAADGTEIADTNRYRLIGNGVMAPCATWLARRIDAAL